MQGEEGERKELEIIGCFVGKKCDVIVILL